MPNENLDRLVNLALEEFGEPVIITSEYQSMDDNGSTCTTFIKVNGHVSSDKDWQKLVEFHGKLIEEGLSEVGNVVLRN